MSLAFQNGKALKYSYTASIFFFIFPYKLCPKSARCRFCTLLIIENSNLTEKPCMNILMPYQFRKLVICTKSWHIFSPGSNFIQTYFLLPSAVKGEQVINLLSVIPKKSKHYHSTLSQFPIHLAHCKHVSDLYPNLYPKI